MAGPGGAVEPSQELRTAAQLRRRRPDFFPYTPATNLLYGLAEAIDMLHEEGLERVFARHDRHAEATRRAVRLGASRFCAKTPGIIPRA